MRYVVHKPFIGLGKDWKQGDVIELPTPEAAGKWRNLTKLLNQGYLREWTEPITDLALDTNLALGAAEVVLPAQEYEGFHAKVRLNAGGRYVLAWLQRHTQGASREPLCYGSGRRLVLQSARHREFGSAQVLEMEGLLVFQEGNTERLDWRGPVIRFDVEELGPETADLSIECIHLMAEPYVRRLLTEMAANWPDPYDNLAQRDFNRAPEEANDFRIDTTAQQDHAKETTKPLPRVPGRPTDFNRWCGIYAEAKRWYPNGFGNRSGKAIHRKYVEKGGRCDYETFLDIMRAGQAGLLDKMV